MKPLPKRGAGESRGLGGCSAAAPPSLCKHCLRVNTGSLRSKVLFFCKHEHWSFKCKGGKRAVVTKF